MTSREIKVVETSNADKNNKHKNPIFPFIFLIY